jgi:acetoin utilization deacetylase AcuC-like enzyme
MIKRWRMTCQGTVDAGVMALLHGISGNISGGYHHSFPDYGHGFCAFNDIGLAVRKLQQMSWIKNALVVDLDTHQGDGTAKVFENDTVTL